MDRGKEGGRERERVWKIEYKQKKNLKNAYKTNIDNHQTIDSQQKKLSLLFIHFSIS